MIARTQYDERMSTSGWWDYVVRTSGTTVQKEMAAATGIGETAFSRWKKQTNRVEAPQVVQFARAYGRPPIEALVAAGYLDKEDAADVIELAVPLFDLDDAELLGEIGRRLDVRMKEYERTLVQILVAIGQLQSYVETKDDDEVDAEEKMNQVSSHLGVLMHSLHRLASHIIIDPSRLSRMTAETAIALRSRQIGHVVAADAEQDLVSQITAWPFDHSRVVQLSMGIEHVRDDEVVRRKRPARQVREAYRVSDDGGLERAPEYDEHPHPELASAARKAPPGYTPGQAEQGEGGEEENQDSGDSWTEA